MFKVHTNERTYYTKSTDARLREQMWAYIRAKSAQGMPLAHIHFTWVRCL